jgi:thioredoxin reductase
MSRVYKNIIVGATTEGLALAEELANDSNDIIVVSSNFIYGKKQIPGVEYHDAEAVYLQYSHGLFVLTVMRGVLKGTICGTNLILATGTKPIKTTLKNSNIYYKALDVPGRHKDQPVVVYGNTSDAATYALDLSKRFGYVYLCTKEFDLLCNQRLLKKVNDKANIVHLPGCSIMACKNDKNGKLAEVMLDTYATITSSSLIFAIGRLPDIPAFSKRYIELENDGFLKVNEHNESTLVPGVFAIGKLCKKYTKRDLKKLVEYLKSRRN